MFHSPLSSQTTTAMTSSKRNVHLVITDTIEIPARRLPTSTLCNTHQANGESNRFLESTHSSTLNSRSLLLFALDSWNLFRFHRKAYNISCYELEFFGFISPSFTVFIFSFSPASLSYFFSDFLRNQDCHKMGKSERSQGILSKVLKQFEAKKKQVELTIKFWFLYSFIFRYL